MFERSPSWRSAPAESRQQAAHVRALPLFGDQRPPKVGSKLRMFERSPSWRSAPAESRQQAAHFRALSFVAIGPRRK